MNYVLRGMFWTSIYLALVLTPLFLLIISPVPAGHGFLYDVSLAIGFTAAAMMGSMFFLTARFKRPVAPFGIDIVYYFHRQVSIIALVFVLAHPVLLFVVEPGFLGLLRSSQTPWHLWCGVFST